MSKHLIMITIGRISQMLIMFLTYRVLSTILSVPDMGVYYFLLSIASAFGLIYANPIGMYTNRMLHAWKNHGVILKNLKAILWSFFFGSLLTIPFLFIFKNKISIDQQNLLFIIGVLVFYVFSTTINNTLIPSLNLLGETIAFVVLTLLTNLIGLVLSYILVKYLSPNPLYWLVGQSISLFIFGVIAYFILPKEKHIHLNTNIDPFIKRFQRVLLFGLPIVITNLAVWSLGQSFRFFYKENVDPTTLGELTFGLGLATSLCVSIEYLFQQLYLPKFYDQINNPSFDRGLIWNKFFDKLISPYILFIFYLIGLSPFILRILADIKFKNSVKFIALGAIVELFRMVGNIFNSATHAEMKTHKAMIPYLAGGALTLLSVFYICKHPALVAFTPFCLMIGHLTALLFLGRNVKSMISIQIDFKSLLKSILISLVFLTALFFNRFSSNLFASILICGFFGLILSYFLFQTYKKSELL